MSDRMAGNADASGILKGVSNGSQMADRNRPFPRHAYRIGGSRAGARMAGGRLARWLGLARRLLLARWLGLARRLGLARPLGLGSRLGLASRLVGPGLALASRLGARLGLGLAPLVARWRLGCRTGPPAAIDGGRGRPAQNMIQA